MKVSAPYQNIGAVYHRMKSIGDAIDRKHLRLKFPDDKKPIAKLSVEKKAEWYAYQFERQPGQVPIALTTSEFRTFWKWRYYWPLRMKRFFFRVKNLEVFKKYDHISVMKDKAKKHGI